MEGWNGLTEMNDTEGTRICWVPSTSSLLAENKYAKTACTVRDLRLATRYEWNLLPFCAVTQRRTVVCSRRFGTTCRSHLHRSDNPRRMPDIVWAIPGILLGSFDLWRRDQKDVPKRRHQKTLRRCITAYKSGDISSYKLNYRSKSFTVVRCWWQAGSYVLATRRNKLFCICLCDIWFLCLQGWIC